MRGNTILKKKEEKGGKADRKRDINRQTKEHRADEIRSLEGRDRRVVPLLQEGLQGKLSELKGQVAEGPQGENEEGDEVDQGVDRLSPWLFPPKQLRVAAFPAPHCHGVTKRTWDIGPPFRWGVRGWH